MTRKDYAMLGACLSLWLFGMYLLLSTLPSSPFFGRQACSCKVCVCDPTCRCDEKAPPPVAAVRVCYCAAQPVPDPKPLLLAFSAKLNPVCVKMKRELDRRPDVKKAVGEKYDLRLYDWAKDKDMCDKYAVRDVPTAILLDVTGKEVRRFAGYKTPNEILRWLDLPCPQ